MNKSEIKNKLNKFVESKKFKTVMYAFGVLFILFFVFQAGMMAGFKRASFGCNWGSNYERNFGPMRDNRPFKDNDFGGPINAHGSIGKIIKVELPNIVVLDKDQTEKSIIIDDNTSILEKREKISKDNLVVDKYIVVIGNPNQSGQIEAKLIRIIPSPEEMIEAGIPEFGDRVLPDFNNSNKQ